MCWLSRFLSLCFWISEQVQRNNNVEANLISPQQSGSLTDSDDDLLI